MSWITRCPVCGEDDSLRVTGCRVYNLDAPLTADGFAFSDAKHMETEHERVTCSVCAEVWDLSELTLDAEVSTDFVVRYDATNRTFESVGGGQTETIIEAKIFRTSGVRDLSRMIDVPLPDGWRLHTVRDDFWILTDKVGNSWLHGSLGKRVTNPAASEAARPVIDSLESLLLEHSAQGVDISDPAYVAGLNNCLETWVNNDT